MTKKVQIEKWDKYNRLTVINEVKWKKRRTMLCICDCWKTKEINLSELRTWWTKSCWCLQKENNGMRKTEKEWNMYWRLKLIKEIDKKWIRRLFSCECSCWNIINVNINALRSWNTKSCWCLWYDKIIEKNTIHWMSWSRINRIWAGMRTRCNNKDNKLYKYYWWRWIKVDDKWNDFVAFYNDMSNSYNEHVGKYWENQTTLDRINNEKWYNKDNCRRATYKEQGNNRRNNITFTY